jgi:LCP family protein required for cell wall assembly
LTTPDHVRQQRLRRRRRLKIGGLVLASLVLLAVLGVVADYLYLTGKIHTSCLSTCLADGATRPTKAPDALKAENFVLIGSDTRAGASGVGTGGSHVQGARSDTTIILHISAHGSAATLVSIPRDSYVQIPACVIGPQGQTSAPQMNKFNAAFAIGSQYNNEYGPACTVHTIETLTGISIDHFAVVDFTGFKRMVNELGGVQMCVATPLDDPIVHGTDGWHGTNLHLPAGDRVQIDGDQALALMRARYALDGGGDLPRIKRQQQFLAAMVRKATSSSLLTNPFKLQSFLSAAASSLTTDGFGLGTMRDLAGALHKTGAGAVHLLTVPNETNVPGLPYGDVQWDPAKAPKLWNAIRHDRAIPGVPRSAKSPSPASSAGTSSPGNSGISGDSPGCLS